MLNLLAVAAIVGTIFIFRDRPYQESGRRSRAASPRADALTNGHPRAQRQGEMGWRSRRRNHLVSA